MNCAFDKEKLTGYYDGELVAAEKAEVERHIASCSECLRELGELKSAAILVKELPRLRAPRSIAEGVSREIQAAGKVHRFASFRRNVLWACSAAAAILVVANVVYFSAAERKEPEAAAAPRNPAPLVAKMPAPAETAAPYKAAEDQSRRGRELEAGQVEENRKSLTRAVENKDRQLRGDEGAKKTEAPRQEPVPERSAAPEAKGPAPRPAPAPVPPPAPTLAPPAEPAKPGALAPAPVVAAGKEDAKPVEKSVDKSAGVKKDGEPLSKLDEATKQKAAAEQPKADAAPTHLTLASTQMAKARPQMEQTLRMMGIRLPVAPPANMKGQASKTGREESTFNLELTESQIAVLTKEMDKLGHSRVVVAGPGDQVLQQFNDQGLFRAKKEVASGGAAARKVPEAPKAESKEKEKDGKEADLPTAKAFGEDKAGEPKRKVVLHLLEVPYMPDAQPAGDPVKK